MSSDSNDLLDNNVPAAKSGRDDEVDTYESSDSEFGPGAPKCPRLEEEDEESEASEEEEEEEEDRQDQKKESPSNLDPGKDAYQRMDRILHSLQQLGNKEEKSTDDTQRVLTLVRQLKELVDESEDEGEVSNPSKLLQIFYKHKKFVSGDEPSIANFLEGLEDDSATKSEEDSETVFVFLAPMATELWYRWDNVAREWQWTPDKEHWMFCSKTTVSGGKWENETPAPENVEIINYLDAIRPVPSDAQYLQQYDVATIFSRLRDFKEEEVSKLVREIGQSILAAQEKWPFQDSQLRFPKFGEE